MLLVRTILDKSRIDGIGVFAADAISCGTPVWRYASSIDRVLRQEDLVGLSPVARQQIEKYLYVDRRTGEAILCGDDARFFNHSPTPNVVDDERDPYQCIAARDISAGEELVCDYFAFDATASEKLSVCRRAS
jgi:SET domain-containing protein